MTEKDIEVILARAKEKGYTGLTHEERLVVNRRSLIAQIEEGVEGVLCSFVPEITEADIARYTLLKGQNEEKIAEIEKELGFVKKEET